MSSDDLKKLAQENNETFEDSQLTSAPSLDRAFSFPNLGELSPRAEFILNPAEIRVLVMGKEGFSASPVSITNFLKEAGFQAEFIDTDNPVTALKAHPDRSKMHCVICPFAQSGKTSGMKILEYLKKMVRCPVVMITYKEGGELTTKLLKAGAADVLSPPFTSDAVFNRLNNVLQNSWLLTQLQNTIAQNKMLQKASEEALNWKQELDELRIVAKDSATKVTELNALVDKLNAERKNLLASVMEDHERQLKEKDERFAVMKEKLENEIRQKAVKIEDLQAEINQLTLLRDQDLEGRLKELSELRSAYQTFKEEANKTRQQLEESVSNLEKTLLEREETITTLKLEVEDYKQKLDKLAHRLAMAQSELTKTVLMKVQPTLIEKELDTKASDIKKSFSSPMESITAELAELTNEDGVMTTKQIKKALKNVVNTLQEGNDLFKPSLEKIFSSVAMDNQTKTWMAKELGGAVNAGLNIDDIDDVNVNVPEDIIGGYQDPILEELCAYRFDVFQYSATEINKMIIAVFNEFSLLKNFGITEKKMTEFIGKIKSNYLEIPYHNFTNAFDVFQACYLYVKQAELVNFVMPVDLLALFIAALCHDMQHPGTNNNFHANSKSDLSATYNDLSCLENYSASMTFKAIRELDLLEHIPPFLFREFKHAVVDAILHTDLSKHFELLAKFNAHGASKPFSKDNIEDRQLLVNWVLHAADISHMVKTTNAKKWHDLAMEENFMQGEKERELGLQISPYCDRDDTDVVKAALNYIDYLVLPTFVAFVKQFSGIAVASDCIKQNRLIWSCMSDEVVLPKVTEKDMKNLLLRKPVRRAGDYTSATAASLARKNEATITLKQVARPKSPPNFSIY